MLTENDVIKAVCNRLRELDFEINQSLHTSEKGIDIIAHRDNYSLFIEAKGETSALETSNRYGKPFNDGQVKNHIGKALLTVMKLLSIHKDSKNIGVAIALPSTPNHIKHIREINYALTKLNILVFWVKEDLEVDINFKTSIV